MKHKERLDLLLVEKGLCDSRSRAQVQALRPHEDEIVRLAFHRPDTIWTLPQLIWVRENEPEVFAKTRYLFFEKDYLRYLLTGVYCTDYIEAEGSMLFDCRTLTWSDELCALAGIDKAILPPIVRPTDRIGGLTAQAAAQTGLVAGTPVICGSTDTVMEVFASGAVQRGDLLLQPLPLLHRVKSQAVVQAPRHHKALAQIPAKTHRHDHPPLRVQGMTVGPRQHSSSLLPLIN